MQAYWNINISLTVATHEHVPSIYVEGSDNEVLPYVRTCAGGDHVVSHAFSLRARKAHDVDQLRWRRPRRARDGTYGLLRRLCWSSPRVGFCFCYPLDAVSVAFVLLWYISSSGSIRFDLIRCALARRLHTSNGLMPHTPCIFFRHPNIRSYPIYYITNIREPALHCFSLHSLQAADLASFVRSFTASERSRQNICSSLYTYSKLNQFASPGSSSLITCALLLDCRRGQDAAGRGKGGDGGDNGHIEPYDSSLHLRRAQHLPKVSMYFGMLFVAWDTHHTTEM
jgi:hypothetical protein